LQEAAQHGALEVCRLLLGRRADVNAVGQSKTKMTPLLSCVMGGDHGEIVSMLLDSRADPSIQASNGFKALKVAQRLQRKQAIELLEKAGSTHSTLPMVEPSSASTSEAQAMPAATNQKVTEPAGTKPVTSESPTQLIEAVEDEDWNKAAELLRAGGCNVNARTRDFGHSVLQEAAQKGALDVCHLLLDQRADVNAKDGSMTTPLMSCVIGGDHSKVVSMLLDARADASMEAYDGSTAFKWAERLRRHEIAAVLNKVDTQERNCSTSLKSDSLQSNVKEDEPPADANNACQLGENEDELPQAGVCDVGPDGQKELTAKQRKNQQKRQKKKEQKKKGT